MNKSSSTACNPRKSSAEKVIAHTRIGNDGMIKDNYDVGNKIGQGNFGKVYEATHRSTGVKWAIKSINKEKAGSSAIKLVEREVAILKSVNHPHVIHLNEVIESPKRMYLVMEMCLGGELADVLKEHKWFCEADTKTIIQRLAGAISYLHKHGIVHRDLKLENILMGQNPDNVDDRLHVKVTDFGLSVVKGGVTPDNMLEDFCGTPIYMAPEILDNKAYSQQCDVWALGIIMYTLLCGYPPFRAKEEAALYDLIREANVEFTDEVWSRVSDQCKKCMQGMLKVDPAHRMSAAEVLNHPWITGLERDKNEPTNVLEMMKMWKDELKQDNAIADSVDSSSTDLPQLASPAMAHSQGSAVDKSASFNREKSGSRHHVTRAREVKRNSLSPPGPSTSLKAGGGRKSQGLAVPKSYVRPTTPTTHSKTSTGNGLANSSSKTSIVSSTPKTKKK
ncbi:serine/threonine-protein kinase 33-like [Littorina saxatilis]|uniref:non-specific serine/threonine protein kinase n=1 Tax=Littorina saxatilis TaxID=31220 RepID=A0AAN9GHE6_9CAEN